MNEKDIQQVIHKAAQAFHGLTASESMFVIDGLLLFTLAQTESYKELYDAYCEFLKINRETILKELHWARESIKAKSQS